VAALRLGNDIGQMRLPFNAKTYRPAPAYRDDHRWMWPADDLAAADLPPPACVPGPGQGGEEVADDPVESGARITHHPEWDRLIARLRPAWCRVIEQTASQPPRMAAQASADTANRVASQPDVPLNDGLSHRLRGPLRSLGRHATHAVRHHEGEVLDIDAVVRAGVARRARCGSDVRVYRVSTRRATQAVVCVLVDQSASTAARLAGAAAGAAASAGPMGEAYDPGSSADSVLQWAARGALAIARALQGMGVACMVAGFSSNGRQAVRVLSVKRLSDAADATLGARLQALRPGGSTRLGAALRHATAACAAAPARHGAARWVLLLSDGEAHDVDVHDPRYLVEDARHAVRSAARRSVRVACVALRGEDPAAARRIFGRRGVQPLGALEALPQVLRRLLG
jgi:nitric oxide reductase activation protein